MNFKAAGGSLAPPTKEPRLVTLFTGQWTDVPFETLCAKAQSFGFQGLEIATGTLFYPKSTAWITLISL
jgi:hypothetical protein